MADVVKYDPMLDRYLPEMTRLLTAQDGVVYLDSKRHRVCIRGPEDRAGHDLGYPWLAEEDVFPFWELRASAQALRGGQPFSEAKHGEGFQPSSPPSSIAG